MPRANLKVTFVLPEGSPPGNYDLMIGPTPDAPKPLAWAHALSRANGLEQQVTVELDLSDVAAGDYYLWTVLNNDEPTMYYPLHIRPVTGPSDAHCGF